MQLQICGWEKDKIALIYRVTGKMEKMEKVSQGRFAAIVLAAGRGKRMKSAVQKQFMLLRDRPVLWYSLQAFEESGIDDIILVTAEADREYCIHEYVEKYGFSRIRAVVSGGKERYHSVYEGLCGLENLLGYGDNDAVLIHDGARPFVDQEIILRIRRDILRYGACVAGMPSKDTVKLADREGFSHITPDRDSVWMIQTPQGFSYPLIKAAYDKMMSCDEYQRGVTDDAMVVESMTNHRVRLTEGSYKNIKVTTPEDMYIAEAFLRG